MAESLRMIVDALFVDFALINFEFEICITIRNCLYEIRSMKNIRRKVHWTWYFSMIETI